MPVTAKPIFSALGTAIAVFAIWILIGVSDWVASPFTGFLLLENGVVASAGLASWPATADGRIFQHRLVSYDGRPFETPDHVLEYVETLPINTEVSYVFERGDSIVEQTIATRIFTITDAVLLFGASFICAIVLIAVAGALLYIAPNDPATLGTAVSFSITGVFALTALDLYGPYHFFRIHAVAECFLGAGMFHMALVFPYRRNISRRFPFLIPFAYSGSAILGGITAITLYSPSFYVKTHRIAIALAGASFLAMVISQLSAYIRPVSYSARQRVAILAAGTFASITPGFVLLLFSAYSGGSASENLIGWAGVFFPISVAYAVLKADALQIDSILRRTVTYAVLTVIIATSYAAIITMLEWMMRDYGSGSRWISILAFSGFCTFGVLPLRNIIQSWVDRLFFRSVYDFRVTIEETSAVLARLIQLDEIQDRIKDAVFDALQPESINFAVYNDESRSQAEGRAVQQADDSIMDIDGGGIAIPFRSHNRIVAILVLGRRLSGRFYSGEDRALLKVLANQGAIAIENALAVDKLRDLNRTLESRVESRTAELATAIDELKDMQVQLIQAERLAAVGELAAGVAHEVNNPLNFAQNSLRALEGLVEELSSYACAVGQLDLSDIETLAIQIEKLVENFRDVDISILADDVKQLSRIIGSGLARTAALVSDLRDFATPKPCVKEPFDLGEVVEMTFQLTGSTLKANRISVEIDLEQNLPQAMGQRSAMSQVVLNVIKNSVDALESFEQGRIAISLSHDCINDVLRLTVEDNGPGIEDQISEKVFEPFFTTKEAGKGTGLGLAMCRRTMRENGGDIWVDPDCIAGTRIVVEVPCRKNSHYTSP